MLQYNKKKIITYILALLLLSTSLYGCNKEDAEAADAAAEGEQADNADDALQAAVQQALGDTDENPSEGQNPDAEEAQPQATAADAPAQTAIAERSPVEITRIEVPDPEPQATGSGDLLANDPDDHNHEPVPNLFPIDECQVEINGIYKVKLAKDLLKEINKRRSEYGIGALTQNTSLLACADARCKEQTYFVGHFRPDGSAFNSVAPGYIQGECIAVDYRTVNDIMEAWFSVNKSRMQIMDPDYTQCGISIYDIDGTYFIAAEFGY